jgi:hypothetical protein
MDTIRELLEEGSNTIRRLVINAVRRFVKAATENVVKFVIACVVLSWVTLGIAVVSSIIYLYMRSIIVPKALLNEPIYFDYTNNSQPIARINLFSQQRQWHYVHPDEYPLDDSMHHAYQSDPAVISKLKHPGSWSRRFMQDGTQYSIDVSLSLPKSPRNMHHGKFMLYLTTFDTNLLAVAKSSRPVIVPYQSWISVLLDTLTHYPLYLFRMDNLHEISQVSVNMMNQYIETKHKITQHLEFTLSTADVDISSLVVTVMPRLTGLA